MKMMTIIAILAIVPATVAQSDERDFKRIVTETPHGRYTTTVTRYRYTGVNEMVNTAGPNACDAIGVSAFEIVNPELGEAVCVGRAGATRGR